MSDPNKDRRVVSQKRQSGERSYEQGVNPGSEEPGLLSKQFYLFICIFLIKIFFKFISFIFNWRKSQHFGKDTHWLIPSAVTLLNALCPRLANERPCVVEILWFIQQRNKYSVIHWFTHFIEHLLCDRAWAWMVMGRKLLAEPGSSPLLLAGYLCYFDSRMNFQAVCTGGPLCTPLPQHTSLGQWEVESALLPWTSCSLQTPTGVTQGQPHLIR